MIDKHIKVILLYEYSEINKYEYLYFSDSKLSKISKIFVEKIIIKYFIEQNYSLLLK